MSIATNFAFAQSGEGQTLYIIDGVVSTKAAVDELPSDMIRNMNVVKGVDLGGYHHYPKWPRNFWTSCRYRGKTYGRSACNGA